MAQGWCVPGGGLDTGRRLDRAIACNSVVGVPVQHHRDHERGDRPHDRGARRVRCRQVLGDGPPDGYAVQSEVRPGVDDGWRGQPALLADRLEHQGVHQHRQRKQRQGRPRGGHADSDQRAAVGSQPRQRDRQLRRDVQRDIAASGSVDGERDRRGGHGGSSGRPGREWPLDRARPGQERLQVLHHHRRVSQAAAADRVRREVHGLPSLGWHRCGASTDPARRQPDRRAAGVHRVSQPEQHRHPLPPGDRSQSGGGSLRVSGTESRLQGTGSRHSREYDRLPRGATRGHRVQSYGLRREHVGQVPGRIEELRDVPHR